jgi:hypothetical protein
MSKPVSSQGSSTPARGGRAPTAAAKPANVIFNAPAVKARLGALKAAAENEDAVWWTPALSFEWGSTRKGAEGTQWLSVYYTDENGVRGRLVMRIIGETHVGQIMPNTDAGVAELNAAAKNSKVKYEKRTKKATIQIQKWAASVETNDDGTYKCNSDGQPILPSDDKLSPYFAVAALVNEAFLSEAKERVSRGAALVTHLAEAKKKDKSTTGKTALDAYITSVGIKPNDKVIVTSSMVPEIRKLFPAEAELILKYAIISTKDATATASLVQENVSLQAPKNAGMPLPNPMTRIAMNFNKTTGVAELAFYDKSLPYMADGKQKYEEGKVKEGDKMVLVNADNVHKFVTTRSLIDGIINMDSVCFSSMGISIPVKADILVVERREGRGHDLDDLYGDDAYAGFSAADNGAAGGDVVIGEAKGPGVNDPTADELNALLGDLAGVDTAK